MPDPATVDRWRRRYFAALRRLRQAGIKTIADEQAGADPYPGVVFEPLRAGAVYRKGDR